MTKTDFSIEESDMTIEEVKEALKKYEREYGMTSEEFLEKWKKGDAYWVAESVVWRGLIDSYSVLNGKKADQLEK